MAVNLLIQSTTTRSRSRHWSCSRRGIAVPRIYYHLHLMPMEEPLPIDPLEEDLQWWIDGFGRDELSDITHLQVSHILPAQHPNIGSQQVGSSHVLAIPRFSHHSNVVSERNVGPPTPTNQTNQQQPASLRIQPKSGGIDQVFDAKRLQDDAPCV